MTCAACLLAPGWMSGAGVVAVGLGVLGGIVMIVGLLWMDYQDECAHRRRMARARRRQHD